MTETKAVLGVPLWSFVVHAVVVFVSVGEFVRVELVLKDYDTRMESIETSYKSHEQKGDHTRNIGYEYARSTRNRRNASSSNELEQIQKLVKSYCSSKNKCAQGPPGPPGRRGRRGPRGRKGPKGDMGIPGRFGKRGIMGPRGLNGDKGDTGPQGMPGLKGDPGQSISSPDVVISPSTMVLNETETAVFHCSSSGNPKPKFTWTKVRGSSASFSPLSFEHKLVIWDVTSNHSGMYQCRASNILGSEQQTIQLTVNYAPQVSLASKPIFVQAGKNITFPRCHVIGSPPPKVTWSRASIPLPHGRTSIQNGDLSVAKLKLSDSDTYLCKANNLLGSSVGRLQLIVIKPVFVDKPPKILKTEKGLSFSMKCTATGSPKPTITWIKKGGSLPPPARSNIREGLLKVNGVRVEDAGVYICIASIAEVRCIQSSTKVNVKRGHGWGCHQGYCYTTTTTPNTWKDARKDCLSIGGDLATIKSSQENSFVAKLAEAHSKALSIWLGLHRDSTKKFKWIDGSPLSTQYSNWFGSEPNDLAEECVEMYINLSSRRGQWNDDRCSEKYIAMCQRRVTQ